MDFVLQETTAVKENVIVTTIISQKIAEECVVGYLFCNHDRVIEEKVIITPIQENKQEITSRCLKLLDDEQMTEEHFDEAGKLFFALLLVVCAAYVFKRCWNCLLSFGRENQRKEEVETAQSALFGSSKQPESDEVEDNATAVALTESNSKSSSLLVLNSGASSDNTPEKKEFEHLAEHCTSSNCFVADDTLVKTSESCQSVQYSSDNPFEHNFQKPVNKQQLHETDMGENYSDKRSPSSRKPMTREHVTLTVSTTRDGTVSSTTVQTTTTLPPKVHHHQSRKKRKNRKYKNLKHANANCHTMNNSTNEKAAVYVPD